MTNSKSLLLLILLLLFFGMLLYAENNQKTFDSDSLEYSLIRDLTIEQGLGAPSSASPWSTDELLKMLHRIDPAKLSPDSFSNYTWVEERLRTNTDSSVFRDFNFAVGIQAVGEMYLHTNTSRFFDEDEEWVQDYTSRAPLLSIPFEFWGTENIYGTIDLTLRNNRFYTETKSSAGFFKPTLSTNLIFDDNPSNTDLSFPWNAYISFGDQNWNMQFGRDTASWGNGSTGNMVIGNHMDYHEFLRFTTYYDPFKYTFLTISFPHPDFLENPENPISSVRTFIGHRFEFLFFEKLRLSLSEGIMYQGDTYDFRFFSPFVILHNYYMRGNSNSILSIEIDYSLLPSLFVHGQLGIDDFALGIESSTSSSAQPNAWGALAGLHYTKSINQGMLHILLEGAYTTPYFYLRDSGVSSDPAAPIDFIVGYQQYTQLTGLLVDKDFLGFKYGGDAVILNLSASYTKQDLWDLYGSMFWMMHGTYDIDTPYGTGPTSASAQTPTTQNYSEDYPTDKNAVEFSVISSVGGDYSISQNLRVNASLDWILKWNAGNLLSLNPAGDSDLQCTVGFSYTVQ